MSAAAVELLGEASAAGVSIRLARGGRLLAPADASPDLLARLRERKAELAALLKGEACRRCGTAMGWPDPVGVVLDDGTALHHACREAAEVERIRRRAEVAVSPALLDDEAELCARGELP